MEEVVGFDCYYPECGKRFWSRHNLTRHVNTAHLEIKPFKCPNCDWYFSSKQNLNSHLRTHIKRIKRSRNAEEMTSLPTLQRILKDKNYGLADRDELQLPKIHDSRQRQGPIPLCPGLIEKRYN